MEDESIAMSKSQFSMSSIYRVVRVRDVIVPARLLGALKNDVHRGDDLGRSLAPDVGKVL